MISSTEEKKCRECEVIRFSRPPGQGPIRPCLSCSVSEDLEESDHTIPALPWSESFSDVTKNDGAPRHHLQRRRSVQKIIHQANMRKKMKLKRLVNKDGACNVIHNTKATYKLDFLTDIFTTLIDLRWRLMLLFFGLAYLSGWAGFSGLWYCLAWWHQDLGYLSRNDTSFEPCVANVDSFIGAFLFSVETQTTIGYGFRSVTEQCWIGVSLVVIQSVFSALVDAILVGCVFAKIARPKKRAATIKFSRNAVIAERNGKLCFMFRIGDIRSSHLFDARTRAQLIRPKITQEEECIPLYSHPMDVGASTGEDNLLLVWPLIICHVIDEKSPMYKYSYIDLLENSFEIVVYLEGVVEQTGLLTQARTSYLPSEIKWGHRFSSHIVSMADTDDNLSIDYTQFNATYPVADTPRSSAYELDFMKKTGKSLKPTLTNGRLRSHRSLPNNLGGLGMRKSSKELRFAEKMEEKFHYIKEDDNPPDYNGITATCVDETESPPSTPTITGVTRWESMESDV
ncbi:G protein-activated inward rectifier potassium channel 3-like [Patiria miniata]|uniref:G protein-activated inward rectifier potassium channel 3 n=1 Tax=Patiria miniata TaxID=46514 RepID=A0A914AR02_PATMI|nr:G protein-activated inward rectifier potassium channel 3-like [Patiria miniata]XP_038065821.1 G protein-activated inward rectifier potassium channel 3-like [Patiria miniata]